MWATRFTSRFFVGSPDEGEMSVPLLLSGFASTASDERERNGDQTDNEQAPGNRERCRDVDAGVSKMGRCGHGVEREFVGDARGAHTARRSDRDVDRSRRRGRRHRGNRGVRVHRETRVGSTEVDRRGPCEAGAGDVTGVPPETGPFVGATAVTVGAST